MRHVITVAIVSVLLLITPLAVEAKGKKAVTISGITCARDTELDHIERAARSRGWDRAVWMAAIHGGRGSRHRGVGCSVLYLEMKPSEHIAGVTCRRTAQFARCDIALRVLVEAPWGLASRLRVITRNLEAIAAMN